MPFSTTVGVWICERLNNIFNRPPNPGRASYEAYAQYEYDMAHYTLDELQPICLEEKTVLDIGCGCGGKSAFFANHGVKQLIAIDIEPQRLQTARAFAEAMGHGEDVLSFVHADATQLPFAADTFDVIVATDAFEHLFHLRETLEECYRVLKPGGKLGFTLLPYFSRDGAHLYDYIFIPWCQFLLPQAWLVAYWKRRFKADYEAGVFKAFFQTPQEMAPVTTIRELVHVNQLTLRHICHLLHQAGFQLVREERVCSRKLGFLKHLPFLNELVVYAYKAVYEKPLIPSCG